MNYGKGKKVNIATPASRPSMGMRNEMAINKGMYNADMTPNIPTPKPRPKRAKKAYNGMTGSYSTD